MQRFAPQSKQAGVELVSDVGSLPEVIGDGDRLAQVFNNLIDNALKHTPAGGQVHIDSQLEGDEVLIVVRDTGPGIPQDELSRIFERFYQLDKSRKGGPAHGSGLGLAIANQIVRAHGGTITVKSILGTGSEFIVRLPVAPPESGTALS